MCSSRPAFLLSSTLLYVLPPLLYPLQVDPLVSLMKVEKVPDSTYDMIGGAEQQIKEIKEVRARASNATFSYGRWLVSLLSRRGERVCLHPGFPLGPLFPFNSSS